MDNYVLFNGLYIKKDIAVANAELGKMIPRLDVVEDLLTKIGAHMGEMSSGFKNFAPDVKALTPHFEKLNETVDGISKSMNKAKSKSESFMEGVGSQIPMFQNLGPMMSNPYMLAGAAAAKAGEVLVDSIQMAMEFGSKMKELENLNMGKSEEELQALRGQILGLSISKGLDPQETIKSFAQIQKATGKYGKEVEEIVGAVGQLSMAVGADQGTMMDSVGKAVNAYRLSGSEIESYLESQAKSAQVGLASFNELAKAQGMYADAAAGAGQSYDTANKFFAAFNKVTKDSEKSAGMTRSIFEGLADPKIQRGLEQIGVSIRDSKGNMLDATQVAGQMNEKFKGMSDQKFSQFMVKVGGSEELKAAFQSIRGEGDALLGSFKEFDTTELSFDQMLEKGKNDPAVMKEIVGNQLEGIQTTLGQTFLPLVAQGLQFVSEKLAMVMDLFGSMNEEGSTFATILDAAKTAGEVLFNIFSFGYRIQFMLTKKLTEFASKSVLVKDIASGIGQIFEWIGIGVEKLFEFIGEGLDQVMGLLNGLESFYLKITGQEEEVNRKREEKETREKVEKFLGDENVKKLETNPELFKLVAKDYRINNIGDISRLEKEGKGGEIKKVIENFGKEKETVLPTVPGATPLSNSGLNDAVKTINDGGKSVRNVTVTIHKLVDTINNNVSNVSEGMRNSEDVVLEGLVRIVRDSEQALGNVG